ERVHQVGAADGFGRFAHLVEIAITQEGLMGAREIDVEAFPGPHQVVAAFDQAERFSHLEPEIDESLNGGLEVRGESLADAVHLNRDLHTVPSWVGSTVGQGPRGQGCRGCYAMVTYHAVRRGIVADGAQLTRFGDYSHASYGMSTIRGHTPCTAVSTAGQTVHRRRVRAARASSARRSGLAL